MSHKLRDVSIDVVVEVDATHLFHSSDGETNANWAWCEANATFKHRDACEFVVYIPTASDLVDVQASLNERAERMLNEGCTRAFVQAYLDAAKAGAAYVLFYA